MMVHPAPFDVLDPTMLAVAHLRVEFTGHPAHASAYPWEGVNALDGFVHAYMNVATLRQQLRPTDRIHGIVTHGGDAPNIIPHLTVSEWYVRAPTRARLDELHICFVDCVEAAAQSSGCGVSIEPQGHTYDDLVSDGVLADVFWHNAMALGRRMPRGDEAERSIAGSTDIGNVSHTLPSIHPMYALDAGGATNHQPGYAAATITPDGEALIRECALGMAWTIIDLAEADRWSELGSGG